MNGILSLYNASFTSCSPAWNLHHSTQVSCNLQETCTTRCKSPATRKRLAPLDASLLQPCKRLAPLDASLLQPARDLHHSTQVSCNLQETCTTRCKSPATRKRLAPLDASLLQPCKRLAVLAASPLQPCERLAVLAASPLQPCEGLAVLTASLLQPCKRLAVLAASLLQPARDLQYSTQSQIHKNTY